VAEHRKHELEGLVIAWNDTRQTPLADRLRVARSMWSRARGLLGTDELPAGDGLLIEPCSSIHSFWMRYAFDALFLNRQGVVVHAISRMRPFRASRLVFSAHAVLELPAGTIEATDTIPGDRVRVEPAPVLR
jgi:uncharacterized membrane protein (UPF0127 family)